MDQGDVPLGEGEGDPGRDERSLAGGEGEVDGGHQVGTGVAGMGVRRERQTGVEPDDGDGQAEPCAGLGCGI